MGFIKQFIYRFSSIPNWWFIGFRWPIHCGLSEIGLNTHGIGFAWPEPMIFWPKKSPIICVRFIINPPSPIQKKHNCLVVWNMNFISPFFWGMLSSQLTFSPWFFRWVGLNHHDFPMVPMQFSSPWRHFRNGEAVPFPRDALTRPSWCTGWMRWDPSLFGVFWHLGVYDWQHIIFLSMNIYIYIHIYIYTYIYILKWI